MSDKQGWRGPWRFVWHLTAPGGHWVRTAGNGVVVFGPIVVDAKKSNL